MPAKAAAPKDTVVSRTEADGMHFDVMSLADAVACQDQWEQRGRPACLIPREMPGAENGRAFRPHFRIEWFPEDHDHAALVALTSASLYWSKMRELRATELSGTARAPGKRTSRPQSKAPARPHRQAETRPAA